MLAWVRAITLRAGWLLTGLSALAAHADVDPGLSGLSARATDASTLYWSGVPPGLPALISRS